jgi:hypothetical protein
VVVYNVKRTYLLAKTATHSCPIVQRYCIQKKKPKYEELEKKPSPERFLLVNILLIVAECIIPVLFPVPRIWSESSVAI